MFEIFRESSRNIRSWCMCLHNTYTNDISYYRLYGLVYLTRERSFIMSCGTCGKDYHAHNCVCKILREIARAQRDVTEGPDCQTSCERSISDLLGQTEVPNNLDTIPVLLYCKDGCKPFKGYGAHSRNIGKIVASYYFRVKSVNDDCCAVLELLRDPNCPNPNPHNPMDQETKKLRATGICITVDLKCFCHVTCLPAISAF